MSILRREHGQVTVLVAAIMIGITGMTAFVVDVGSWFRTQRSLQSTVDAAALAGAQALPTDPATAYQLAQDYWTKNGGSGQLDPDVSVGIRTTYDTSDTIWVSKDAPADGFFGKVLGVLSVKVHAKATALVGPPSEVQYVAPIVVNYLHPDLTGADCAQTTPCFGPEHVTTIPLGKNPAPGAFDLLNLDPTQTNGTVGASTMADWIQNGYEKYLPLGGYFSGPGAKYNGNQIDNALAVRQGTELLFPIYDTLVLQGSNATYHIIGWVGFHLQSGVLQGSSGSLTGYFTRVLWRGLLPTKGQGGAPNKYGVSVVALVN